MDYKVGYRRFRPIFWHVMTLAGKKVVSDAHSPFYVKSSSDDGISGHSGGRTALLPVGLIV